MEKNKGICSILPMNKHICKYRIKCKPYFGIFPITQHKIITKQTKKQGKCLKPKAYITNKEHITMGLPCYCNSLSSIVTLLSLILSLNYISL